MEMYNNLEEMKTFKGFHVFTTDGSFVELSDHTQTQEEMEIPPDTKFESYVARAKISCIVDTKMDFVISSIIENQFIDEITLALTFRWYKKQNKYEQSNNLLWQIL